MSADYDYDWIVIGSGFGGSVSALRLAEKGHRVAVLECGARFDDEEFAEKTSDAKRYYWIPQLGLKGILRMTLFRDIFIGSGCGVGGGSLGYANTLYRARPDFYMSPQWSELAHWESELERHYDEAERMLGVTDYDEDTPADLLLKEFGESIGVGDTYRKTRVGVFLGEPGRTVADPYFGGEGPDRTGCLRCGSCMVGCRYGAKNTLRKNYLWFAEKLGVEIQSERTVTDVKPLDGTGAAGYTVTSVRSGAWLGRERRTLRARGVVVAAGALGTNRLLQRCKLSGSLPNISDRLGYLVRTNSESIMAVTAGKDDPRDFTKSVSITSSIYTDKDTHIEVVTYGRGGDSQSLLFNMMVHAGSRGTQPLQFALAALRHPLTVLKASQIKDWSRRTIILLVMQTLDNSIRLKVKRRLPGGNVVLTTEQDPEHPNPVGIPVAYEAARWFANKLGGTAQSGTTEGILAIPSTAHILGGAAIGASPRTGVVDSYQRVFGYDNLLVCDGAAIPANIGVNPSLTITAMTERAMTFV
ncbi:MAG TPA: GMC family oxidoreductase [Solirubrobacteraceae bacterium]|nr:GMC family oxidoreductase [Solirubrobacteraceae bacterium]